MKPSRHFALLLIAAAISRCITTEAQSFQNLNFEEANVSTIVSGPYGSPFVMTSAALPHWTAYLGNTQDNIVGLNFYTTGDAGVEILGPNYPAASSPFGPVPGRIDGEYTVLLQQGAMPGQFLGILENASIAQTGLVPVGSQSLQFKAWSTGEPFSVSFNGNDLSPVVLGTGANDTLYGVDISPCDGEVGTLEFTALPGNGGSWLGLDDITFSTQVVPEPSPVILTAVASLLFASHRRRLRQNLPQHSTNAP